MVKCRMASALLCMLLSLPLRANPAVHFSDTWARATFPMAETGAIYLTLMNHSGTPVTLLSVSVPQSIATEAQLHTTRMHEGMMTMQEVENGIKLMAHGHAVLQPGGDHIMLMGLEQGLAEGATIPLTLHFDDATQRTIDVPVRSERGEVNGHQHH